MKELRLVVSKSGVMEEVGMVSGYRGRRLSSAAENVYSMVSTTDGDSELLDEFWRESCGEVAVAFGHWLRDSITGDAWEWVLSLTDNWNWGLVDELRMKCRQYIVHRILHRWYGIVNASDAESEGVKAAGTLSDIEILLQMRVRRIRGR